MIVLNGQSLTLESLHNIARNQEEVVIDESSKKLVNIAADYVKQIAKEDKAVYGINTGFGHLAHVKIDKQALSDLQVNLLKSHACGMGEPLSIDVVRAMMALRINALIQGYSGIRLETIEKMVTLLNLNIIPVVFEKGSLGASGDLALLSHMSLPLIGLGEVYFEGQRMDTMLAFEKAKIKPLEKLHAKEGLSLINGTQAMGAIGGLVLYDAIKLLDCANLALAMTMEALEGIVDAFHPLVHHIRRQDGQMMVAKEVLSYLKDSAYVTKQNEKRVQDAYSIRCAPQVHGATRDALMHIRDIVEKEMNAVTDNPLIFVEEHMAISAGNFHGQPLALAFDYLGIAVAELANISERRIERMVNPHLSGGLPAFLAKYSGLNSGFMIIQYTAASLVSENKVLAHPASVDSIPSSANQEDHVSMGSISARKAQAILDHTRKVIALEMLTAAQALDFKEKRQQGIFTKKAYMWIRKKIPFMTSDEVLYPLMHDMEEIIKDPAFYDEVFEGDY